MRREKKGWFLLVLLVAVSNSEVVGGVIFESENQFIFLALVNNSFSHIDVSVAIFFT